MKTENSIINILTGIYAKTPDHAAIESPGKGVLTYRGLHDQVLRVVASLNAMGIGRNDRVAVVLPNGPDMAAAFLSVACCATAAPLNPGYREAEFEFYLSDLNAKALMIQSGMESPARRVAEKRGIPLIELEPEPESCAGVFTLKGGRPERSLQGSFAEPDDISLVLHTSGTTSRPKIVPLTQANICVSARNIMQTLNLTEEDRCMNIMPLFHIHGLIGCLLSSITAGASVICAPGFIAPKFFEWMKTFKPTWYSAVPSMHQSILSRAGDNMDIIRSTPLRFIRSSSASLPPRVMKDMEEAFNTPVIEAYGMTEASHQMASNPLPPGIRKPGSVGVAAGPEVAVMDETGKLRLAGETGEIVIRGGNVTPGYEANPEANAGSFTGGWFRTGDQGYLDKDGYLFLTGRLKEIINRGGEKISPREVDDVLMEHPAVRQAVTFAIPHPRVGESVGAAVVLKDGVTASGLEIQEFAAGRLADFKVPEKVIFLEEIPKGATGKVQRIGLAEKLGITVDEWPVVKEADYAAPRNVTEEKLCAIWSEALGVEKVGIHDNFLYLGGDSVLAAKILILIQDAFQAELSLVLFFQAGTVANLASEIKKHKQGRADRQDAPAGFPVIIPDPARRHDPFPLMDIQQAYWVGRSGIFELGNVSTHRYIEMRCESLDISRFTAAWRKLIDRHDMLRAVVLPDGNQQILERVPPYTIAILDLRGKDPKRVADELLAVREQMSHQVLPSDTWPLFEIRASQLGDREFILHFSLDALVLDIWSRHLIFRECRHFYMHPDVSLKKLELSFRDYVMAEKSLDDSWQYKKSREYWLKRLPELPSAPELPLAQSPASLSRQRFKRRSYSLDSAAWDRLKKRARQARLTSSGILLAAFAAILKVWSRNPRFTINLTLYNCLPLHPQANEIVGDFTSLILLAVDEQPRGISFEDRAIHLQKQFWEDLDNRYFSGIRVLRELNREQTPSNESTSMSVVFTSAIMHGRDDDNRSPMKWLGDITYSITQTPQVWIDHQVFEEDGALLFNWDAVEDLFPAGLMDDMFASYCSLLKRLSSGNAAWRKTWPEMAAEIVPAYQLEQRRRINATEAPVSDEMLHTLFASQVSRRPDNPAVIASGRTLTYRELYFFSNRIGNMLRRMGAKPNTLVAVVMRKGWEQVAAVTGILASGAAYLPVDASLPKERLWYLLKHGEVNIVLTQPDIHRQMEWPDGVQCVSITSGALADIPEDALTPSQCPDDLAYVIFTSGSTGLPKGVSIDHRGAVNTVRDINERFHVGAGDRVLALSSLSFDLSVYDIFGTLAAGGTVIMPAPEDTRDPSRWARLIKAHGVTVWNSVPALMGLLMDYIENHSDLIPATLRLALMSGDWIPMNLPRRIKEVIGDIQVVSLGGATEASIWSILYPVDEVDPGWKSIPYGKPMKNQRFHVLNDTLTPCPVWAPGQLYIGGIGLAKGYWRDEERTAKSFITHPETGERLYRTGDSGRYLPDGNIEFLGREDFQVKVQGFRVELGDIEFSLSQHPDIRSSVVVASGDRDKDKQLVAYIVPGEGTAPLPENIRGFLKNKLPDYMIPSLYMLLSGLPLTLNGKIDRKALPEPPDAQPLSGQQSGGYSDGVAAKVKSLVEQILETGDIGSRVSLLSLGATSIHMIRIVNLLEKEMGFRPGIDEFYNNPTIEGLAMIYDRHIAGGVGYADGMKTAAEPEAGYLQPSYKLVLDPVERALFKDRQPGLRGEDHTNSIELYKSGIAEYLEPKFITRRSHRQFLSDPIRFDAFSGFLNCLRQIKIDGKPKYLYGSAGGLYPVQTYVYAKPDRIDRIDAGIYYYHPVNHRLMPVSGGANVSRDIYDPLVNRPIFDSSAFSIFLISQMNAIGPMYGYRGLHYSTIEAGVMAQLMETEAPQFNIGLCQIGSLHFEKIRPYFDLNDSHVLIHSMLGGLIDVSGDKGWAPFQEIYIDPEEREEGEI